jgi:hypothetical protein
MKLVHIKWVDHSSFTENTWRTKDEYEDREPVECDTVGWVIKEDKDMYVVVSTMHLSEEYEDKFCGDMCILKGSVKSVRELK